MNVKKANEILGNALFGMGAVKMIYVIGILLLAITSLTGESFDISSFSLIQDLLGFAEITIAVASIVMVIANMKEEPEVIPGYLLGIGALILELITPSILSVFSAFAQCSMYMKGGTIIKNKNFGQAPISKVSKQMIKDTDWFYTDKK